MRAAQLQLRPPPYPPTYPATHPPPTASRTHPPARPTHPRLQLDALGYLLIAAFRIAEYWFLPAFHLAAKLAPWEQVGCSWVGAPYTLKPLHPKP